MKFHMKTKVIGLKLPKKKVIAIQCHFYIPESGTTDWSLLLGGEICRICLDSVVMQCWIKSNMCYVNPVVYLQALLVGSTKIKVRFNQFNCFTFNLIWNKAN